MSRTILAIDDDMAQRKLMSMVFAGAGYTVHTAVDGADGLAKAAEIKPDLIITDVMMPDMDGYTLLSKLKADAELSGIPVIVLTGQISDRYKTISEGLGAVHHMDKPINPPALLKKVEELLAQ